MELDELVDGLVPEAVPVGIGGLGQVLGEQLGVLGGPGVGAVLVDQAVQPVRGRPDVLAQPGLGDPVPQVVLARCGCRDNGPALSSPVCPGGPSGS